MKIDRHNYEEYFILYMDNELGSDDRSMVEAFVLQHPDLKEELDLLLQYKLTPDTGILFPGKEDLIKVNGETPITQTNYEEWLLLYIDNELNADQRDAVERFIADKPSIQEELALLERIKLQPEQIVFAGKGSLYRKEEKVRPLPVRWWRIAAAAVLLLGIGITTAVVVNKKSSGGGDIVKGNSEKTKTNSENPVITPVKKENAPVNEIVVADNVRQAPAPSVKPDNKNTVVKNNNIVVKDKLPANIPSPVKKEEQAVANSDNNKPTNNLPQPLNNPSINKNNATNDVAVNSTPSKEITNPKESLTSVTNVTTASYNNNNDADQLEEGGKNKKNRGFLRKLTRTFEKRTNMTATDDDKLLVGGLAFKLK
ncbi:MAG TPA: hypothetical protein VK483_17615 [Chitinophagaceae bacterium]|nr:hypothetical protein [Chitinophagaceae bacterium]